MKDYILGFLAREMEDGLSEEWAIKNCVNALCDPLLAPEFICIYGPSIVKQVYDQQGDDTQRVNVIATRGGQSRRDTQQTNATPRQRERLRWQNQFIDREWVVNGNQVSLRFMTAAQGRMLIKEWKRTAVQHVLWAKIFEDIVRDMNDDDVVGEYWDEKAITELWSKHGQPGPMNH